MSDYSKRTKKQLIQELTELRHELKTRDFQKSDAAEVSFSTLYESAHTIKKYGEFSEIAEALFHSCKALTGATAGYVALLSDDKQNNEVIFLDSGGSKCTVDPTLPMPVRGLRAETYKKGHAVYDNEFSDGDWPGFLPAGHMTLNNVLFAPMMINKQAVGLLGLANKSSGFTDEDKTIASTFGELAALALFNRRIIESLKISENRFSSVIESSLDAIISTNSEMEITSWNQGAKIIFGYQKNEVVGRSFDLLIPEYSDRPIKQAPDHMIFGDDRAIPLTIELTGTRKDSSRFPVEMTFSTWMLAEENYFTFIIRDISERKKAELKLNKAHNELELRVAERTRELSVANDDLKLEIVNRTDAELEIFRQNIFLKNIVESITYPFYVIDAEKNTIVLANSASGFKPGTKDVCCFKHIRNLDEHCSKHGIKCPLDEAKKTKQTVIVEQDFINDDGTVRNLEIHVYPIFDRDSNITQFIQYMIDVTDRKKAETEYTDALQFIEKSSKMASIGVMTAGINHEINQPLTAIKFHVDGLLYWEKNNKGAIPDMIIESLRDISDGIGRIDEIIKHMRSFWGSSDQLERNTFDVNDTIRQAMSLLDRQLSSHLIETELLLNGDSLPFYGFRVHLEQIIINLVVNAIHALDEVERDTKKITISTKCDGHHLELSVSDNGPGMDIEYSEKLFEPFYSKRKFHEGMGLGLAIVKFFTDEHNGTIIIDDNKPVGVVVTIRFPVTQQPGEHK